MNIQQGSGATGMKFKNLLEPGQIGTVKIKNRIIKTACGTHYWHRDDLHMNRKVICYYEALAKGGAGLIIAESPTVDFQFDNKGFNKYRLDDDRFVPGLSELAQAVHKHGCPVFLQLYHKGNSPSTPVFLEHSVAASAITPDTGSEIPRELTITEIEIIKERFVSATERAMKAGFDGIEINASCDHLLNTFLSSCYNKRKDIYGCDTIENRSRIVVEIIKDIKKRCGLNFPVIALINGAEAGGDGKGTTLADSKKIARLLQNAGADAIHLRAAWIGHHIGSFNPDILFFPEPYVPLDSFPKEFDWSHHGKGANIPLATAIKRAVNIPVIVVGTISPDMGEKALRRGDADYIGLCRAILADPELPNKLSSGRISDIRPCTSCGECLRDHDEATECRVNAALGSEEEYTIKPADKRKTIVVIGGGPSGIEAARVSAIRGHRVILYEKSEQLGGLMPLAALIKGSEVENIQPFLKYLKNKMAELGVDVRLNQEADAATMDSIKPDAVIIATGGLFTKLDIPGIDNRIIINAAELHRKLKHYLRFFSPGMLRWLTKIWMPIGKRVIIIGGDLQGLELAEFLVKRGRRVAIVESSDSLGTSMLPHLRFYLLSWLNKKGVKTFTGVKLEKINEKCLTITTREGKSLSLEADNIITALPLLPDNSLINRLANTIPVYATGDCNKPGVIKSAVADAYRLAKIL
jgi:2,4-dienoyl-CoA reductase (NADPH2)